MQPYAKVERLSKSYGEHRVLSDLELTIDRGEAVAVTGPSGCGKTTLLNILGLLETYDAGSVYLAGMKYPGIETRQAMLLRRTEINYLFQSFALIDSRTVRDNLMLALHYAKLDKKAREAAIRRELGRFSILDKIDSPVNELSGGEKQRVAICRAMLKPGGLILADEPTGSLDAHMAGTVMDSLIFAARSAGKTLVVVTHDMAMAAKCDRVLRMRSGKLA